MNYLYCSDCGGRTVQGPSLVKFCSVCGEPFVKTASIIPPKPAAPSTPLLAKKKKKRPEPEEEYEEDDDLEDVEDDIDDDDDYDEEEARERVRSKINLEDNPLIVEVKSPKVLDINQLAGTRKKVVPVNKINVREKSNAKLSKKEFEKQWKDEAGTARRK